MSEREDELVAWLRRRLPRGGDRLGDDTARLPAQGPHVVTVDQQIEGVHFPAGLDGATIGRRLLARQPLGPRGLGRAPALGAARAHPAVRLRPPPLFRGLLAAELASTGSSLVGGDLARGPWLAAAAHAGRRARARRGAAGRDRARPGDSLWLGGTVGDSGLGRELLLRGARPAERRVELPAGLVPAPLAAAARRAVARHLRPVPQLALGRALAGTRGAGAAIDLSDGLALDLRRICRASGVGAEIDLAQLHRALAPRFEPLAAALDLSAVGLALGGGEDYVLLFTLRPGVAPPRGHRALRIGTILDGRALRLRDAAGRRHPLPRLGWDHLAR